MLPAPAGRRDRRQRRSPVALLAGVSAAFARRYAINRLVARIAMLTVAIVFTPLAYLLLWVLMPKER